MDAALNHLRSQGTDTKPEDVARLSPLAGKHYFLRDSSRRSVRDDDR
jgi:hypothetical protein